ncbi:MAG: ATP-grasp domain-containing protein [Candidatus Omnitrophota bacterium]
MPLLIGLVFDLKPVVKSIKKPNDFLAEFDTEETISSIENALARCGSSVLKIGSAKSLLEVLPRLQCDIIFNIAEGEDGRNRESQVPAILEVVDIPYVGSDALTLAISLDKVFAKRIFAYHNIPTPRYFECKDERNIVVSKGLNFPLIVKPRYEGSAKGITPDSKVSSDRELKRQVKRIIKIYDQPALVEEFISDREFTVGIIGNENPLIFPVVQRHLEAKTNLSSHIFEKCGYDKSRLKYQELSEIESDLELEIKRLSLEAFRAIECRDFARVDFRVGSCASTQGNEKIYVLEINPLPSLATDDYFALSAESFGMSYDEMINMILEAAVKRYECLQKTYTHIQNIAR